MREPVFAVVGPDGDPADELVEALADLLLAMSDGTDDPSGEEQPANTSFDSVRTDSTPQPA